jgi:hypothetical protein
MATLWMVWERGTLGAAVEIDPEVPCAGRELTLRVTDGEGWRRGRSRCRTNDGRQRGRVGSGSSGRHGRDVGGSN